VTTQNCHITAVCVCVCVFNPGHSSIQSNEERDSDKACLQVELDLHFLKEKLIILGYIKNRIYFEKNNDFFFFDKGEYQFTSDFRTYF